VTEHALLNAQANAGCSASVASTPTAAEQHWLDDVDGLLGEDQPAACCNVQRCCCSATLSDE
jgi:hypothetical protein